jgi:hypothetical protein
VEDDYAFHHGRFTFQNGVLLMNLLPNRIYRYCIANKTRVTKWEPILAKCPHFAFLYAKDILKGRFQAAEAVIATDASLAQKYAVYVLKGPFPAGEATIAMNPGASYYYAVSALHARFKKGEEAIKKHAQHRTNYERMFKIKIP